MTTHWDEDWGNNWGGGGDIPPGYDPQMLLKVSTDGGKTWSKYMYSSMGKLGDSKAEVRFPRLGAGEDWVFEVQVSDPVRRNIIAAYVES